MRGGQVKKGVKWGNRVSSLLTNVSIFTQLSKHCNAQNRSKCFIVKSSSSTTGNLNWQTSDLLYKRYFPPICSSYSGSLLVWVLTRLKSNTWTSSLNRILYKPILILHQQSMLCLLDQLVYKYTKDHISTQKSLPLKTNGNKWYWLFTWPQESITASLHQNDSQLIKYYLSLWGLHFINGAQGIR